jgi:hypothetical protein
LAKLTALTSKSPIADQVSADAKDSVASILKKTSQHFHTYNVKCTEGILKYCTDWERIVTTRVDADLAETKKLHDSLDHYTTKVEGLRKKTNKVMEAEQAKAGSGSPAPFKAVPDKLGSRLDRNEGKLSTAWKAQERSASALCNLLEEVTLQGYNDLYPMLVDWIEWEIRRASIEYDLLAEFKATQEKLTKKVTAERKARLDHLAELRDGPSDLELVQPVPWDGDSTDSE